MAEFGLLGRADIRLIPNDEQVRMPGQEFDADFEVARMRRGQHKIEDDPLKVINRCSL